MIKLPDLSQRSSQLELLDAPDIPTSDLWRNLYELDRINALLGGHQATLQGLQQLHVNPHREWHILDVGCGGGDTLSRIRTWGHKQGLRLKLTGVDLHADAIRYAELACQGQDIGFVQANYLDLSLQPDIVISSLFCHHLSPKQLHTFLCWVRTQARFGFVLNDLHRHSLAYHSIKLLTRGLSRSYLVQHDAPLSVWRGFQRQELKQALTAAKLHPQIKWFWAFRWLVYGNV